MSVMEREYKCYKEYFEVMAHDVDANNNIKPSVLVKFLQETANHHMRDRKPTYYELFSQGKSYILIRMKVEIKGALHPYDRVEVSTWTSINKGATFKRNYILKKIESGNSLYEDDLESSSDEIIALGYSEWAVVNINTGNIYRVEDIDTSNFEVDEPLELSIPTKFHFPKGLEMEHCGSKHIEYTDCDMNLHMNNTLYQDMLWNCIPDVEHKNLVGFTMRFMREGAYGKTMDIYRAPADDLLDNCMNEGMTPDGHANANEAWYLKSMIDESETNVEAIFYIESPRTLKNY